MSAVETIQTIRTLSEQQIAAATLWEQWICADIEARMVRCGRAWPDMDAVQVQRFTIEAICYRLDHPDDATQVDVTVDDGSVSRRYASSTGQLVYQDAWWGWLGLDCGRTRSAFSITPSYRRDCW